MMEEIASTASAVDWWARGVGFGALTVSLIAVGWNIYNAVSRDRARLKVDVEIGLLSRGQNYDFSMLTSTVTEWIDCITVTASNVGRRPMSLQRCTLELDNGKQGIFTPGATIRYGPHPGAVIDESHKMPKRLEEGESHTFYFPLDTIEELKEVAQIVVRDGTGKKWKEPLPEKMASAGEGTQS